MTLNRRDFVLFGLAVAGCGGSSSVKPQFHEPTDPVFSYTDCCSVNVTTARARFSRPTIDGQGFETTNPGARVRFEASGSLAVNLGYTALVTRTDTYQDVGSIEIDGIEVSTFRSPAAEGTPATLTVPVASDGNAHAVSIVMPYCASVDFLGASGVLQPALSPPPVRYAAAGDSITQGFDASRTTKSWPYGVAAANGWQIVNHGYGGRVCVPADGTTVAGLAPGLISYLIGYNDFSAQVPVAAFQANVAAFIRNVRAASAAPLFCITPIYSPNAGSIPLEGYRQAIRNAVAAANDPLTMLVEGLDLMPADDTLLQDGVHPNDAGSAAIIASLAPVLARR
jgi:lysophospholipase L1-like esterase